MKSNESKKGVNFILATNLSNESKLKLDKLMKNKAESLKELVANYNSTGRLELQKH